jgi:transcriptional regulator with XRE-family HTH domain
MTSEEFLAYRRRLGWSLATLARKLGVGSSRLADYEAGHSRGKHRRPAPIPKTIELALRWLELQEHCRNDSPEAWLAVTRRLRTEAALLPPEPRQRRRLNPAPESVDERAV